MQGVETKPIGEGEGGGVGRGGKGGRKMRGLFAGGGGGVSGEEELGLVKSR